MSFEAKKRITEIFKLHGLSVRSEGAKYFSELLKPIPEDEHDAWIEKVIDAVQKLPLASTIISQDVLQQAVENVSAAESDDTGDLLQVIDVFKAPKLVYHQERKKFMVAPQTQTSLHGNADNKTALFIERYTRVYQRTVNHDLFRPPAILDSQEEKKFGLVKIEYLLGASSRLENVVVLGLFTQLTEGQHHLEDDTGILNLDLSNTKFHTGLFTFNCFVLAEGWFEDSIFHVNAMGMPPPEAADTTRAMLGNVNYFGGEGTVCAKSVERLREAELENNEAMFVIISDVWLDSIKVREKLEVLFTGYADFPPTAFILCGNFLSAPHGPQQAADLKAAFASLADIIAENPSLIEKSNFIFVPGPNDPGLTNIFPRPPLPKFITSDFEKRIPCAEFVSNPCRLLYCTQEIVIFRENIMTKMCRNCFYFPNNTDDIPFHFSKTIVNQAHLAPLPLHIVPVYWGLDHCLALHPTPDVIVTADKGDPFNTTMNKATFMNPGSFAKTDFSFMVYYPSSRQVEASQIEEKD
ncbi:DNA polymerase epsilon subunit 2 [Oratosquilla oratoria]|uniref:DNA polymerase epsilon subunit 2 n=1 Tax=Oratosquilla oratoria TaxID=337810 RepID=UPI003F75B69B